MGKGTNQIATEVEAKAIGGATSSVTTDKCTTKTKATSLGCTVSGTYTDNQTVKYSDLSKATTKKYYKVTFREYSSKYIQCYANDEQITSSGLSFEEGTKITITFGYTIYNARTEVATNFMVVNPDASSTTSGWLIVGPSSSILGESQMTATFTLTSNAQVQVTNTQSYTSKTITFNIGEGVTVRCSTLNSVFVTMSDGDTITSCYSDEVQLEVTDYAGYTHATSFSPSISGASDAGFTMPNSNVTVTITTTETGVKEADGDRYEDIVILSIPDSIGYRTLTTLKTSGGAFRTPCTSLSHYSDDESGLLNEELTANSDLTYAYPEFDANDFPIEGHSIALSTFYPSFFFKIPHTINGVIVPRVKVTPCFWNSTFQAYSPMVSNTNIQNDYLVFTIDGSGSQDISFIGDGNNDNGPFQHGCIWDFDETGGKLIYYWFAPNFSYTEEGGNIIEMKSIPTRFCIEALDDNYNKQAIICIDVNYVNDGMCFSDGRNMSPIDRLQVTSFIGYDENDVDPKELQITCIDQNGSGVSSPTDALSCKKLGSNSFFEFDQSIHHLHLGFLEYAISSAEHTYSNFHTAENFSYEEDDRGYVFRLQFPTEKEAPHNVKMTLAVGLLIPKRGSTAKKYVWDYFEHSRFSGDNEYITINITSPQGLNDGDIQSNGDNFTQQQSNSPITIVKFKENGLLYADIIVNINHLERLGIISGNTLGYLTEARHSLSVYISFVCHQQYYCICSNPFYKIPNSNNTQVTQNCTDISLSDTDNLYSITVNSDYIIRDDYTQIGEIRCLQINPL